MLSEYLSMYRSRLEILDHLIEIRNGLEENYEEVLLHGPSADELHGEYQFVRLFEIELKTNIFEIRSLIQSAEIVFD